MTHHAYYIEGSLSQFEPLRDGLRPFWAAKFDKFGVDDARDLVALAALKNISEATFLAGISSITSEAQQALLKLLEEPQPGTTFIILLPHGVLLPTLRSRMLPYGPQGAEQKSSGEALAFLSSTQKVRSAQIAGMLDDEEGAKDRVRDFLLGLEQALSARIKESRVREGLEDIARVRSYVADRSPSLKILLEHLAVALPKL
jgi:hypothetical protein